jgi:hydrogenase/urease accessory protein HupE
MKATLHRAVALLLLSLVILLALPARAHDEPTSFIDLRLTSVDMEVDLTASITDLAHDLTGVEPDMLLKPETLEAQRRPLEALISTRLHIGENGAALPLELKEIVPVPEKRDLRLVFAHAWRSAPEKLQVSALMFPYDARHRTFVNVYNGEEILRQDILTNSNPEFEFATTKQQSLLAVVGEFLKAGIHHIFIGPDHILFVVGLMLLGGSLGQLLRIVTAFTIAHSITLGLATFRIFSPPSSVVEPVIALSIVFVGVHALFGKRAHDPRLLFAFCFGLVHGFGFASVLQEMVLPRQALGWSLFAFNAGVEVGQGCIVLTVAPLLAFLRRRGTGVADRVVSAGALGVTAAGAFWFFQRVM